MIDTVRGVLRVRKWPKKRGTPKSALQRWWIDWFTQANLLAKYADGLSQAGAIALTKGSGLYPRDVLLAAMRGRLYWWADETGWKWFPVAAITDITNALDILAQTIGSVLVRAPDRWRAPTPGTLDQVLTLKGSPLVPEWAAPGGGGVPFGGALVTSLANQAVASGVWAQVIFAVAWTLHCNIPIARRRTLCFVEDDDEILRWSGKTVGAALRWLHENDHSEIELHGAQTNERFYVNFRPVSTESPSGE